MTDPTPITLGEGEALYRAGDLPDEGWEAVDDDGTGWVPPSRWPTTAIVVARRIQWTPKPGDRVVNTGKSSGSVVATYEHLAWVKFDGYLAPQTERLSALSPEDPS